MSAICVTQSAGSDDPCIMTSSSLGGHLTGWGVRDWVGGHLVRWVRNWEVRDERWGWEAPKAIEWKDFSIFAPCPFWRNPQEEQKVPSWQKRLGTCLKGSSCLQGTKQFTQPTCSFTFWVRLRTCLARGELLLICNCGTETPLLILRPSLPESPKLDRGDY